MSYCDIILFLSLSLSLFILYYSIGMKCFCTIMLHFAVFVPLDTNPTIHIQISGKNTHAHTAQNYPPFSFLKDTH